MVIYRKDWGTRLALSIAKAGRSVSFGDIGNESTWVPHGGLISIQMPTAIARYYAPEGFAIAADGRKVNLRHPSESDYETQKIFKIDEPGRRLSYSVAGTVELSPDDESDDIVFYLLPALAESVTQAKRTSRTLTDYARSIAGPVNRQLADLKRRGTIRRYPVRPSAMRERGHTILRVYFDGYYRDIEARAYVRFYHENQTLAPVQVLPQETVCGGPITFGSSLVSNLLFTTIDQRLARFRKNWDTETLAGGIEMCQSYIAACSSPEGRDIDNEVCSRIGGRIHIASITSTNGFQWVEGFNPKGAK